VDLGRGFFRLYMMKLPYIPARTVTFYCRGIEGEIRDLLRDLPALGKKAVIGFGAISSYSVDVIEEDLSVVCNGVAMRPIPRWALKSWSELVPLAYKPPYWDKRNIELCAPPGSRVALNEG